MQFRVWLLAAQAQALARPAEGELDAGQAFLTGPLGEKLAGYFHGTGAVPSAAWSSRQSWRVIFMGQVSFWGDKPAKHRGVGV